MVTEGSAGVLRSCFLYRKNDYSVSLYVCVCIWVGGNPHHQVFHTATLVRHTFIRREGLSTFRQATSYT